MDEQLIIRRLAWDLYSLVVYKVKNILIRL